MLGTSMAQRIPATRQNTPLIAIKIRRVTARQPEGVQSKRAAVHSEKKLRLTFGTEQT